MFIDDLEKIHDLLRLSKEEFLFSYSYLTEQEYEDTVNMIEYHFQKLVMKGGDYIENFI